MTKEQALKEISNSHCSYQMKFVLSTLVVEWEEFLRIKKKHRKKGLLNACYKTLGIKFIGMYGISSLDDIVRKAKENNLLA